MSIIIGKYRAFGQISICSYNCPFKEAYDEERSQHLFMRSAHEPLIRAPTRYSLHSIHSPKVSFGVS